VPRIPGVNHLDAVRALEKAGFRVIRQGKHISAKFWPNPVSLAHNLGFKPKELRAIERLLGANEAALLAAWQEHMGRES
jgi:hypothetical protein